MSDESPSSSTGESRSLSSVLGFGLDRRRLLKTIGVGAGATLSSGIVSADDEGYGDVNEVDALDEDGSEQASSNRCRQKPCFHPFSGFTVLPDEIDATKRPAEADHTVSLHVEVPPEETCGFFMFDPAGIHVQPGDVVEFEAVTNISESRIAGDHTVTAYHPAVSRQRRIPSDATAFSSPMIGTDVSWLYQFETEGVYDIYCGPHEGLGMVMRIVVGDETATDFGTPAQPGAIPPLGLAGDVLAADALTPSNIVENGPIPWNDDLCPN